MHRRYILLLALAVAAGASPLAVSGNASLEPRQGVARWAWVSVKQVEGEAFRPPVQDNSTGTPNRVRRHSEGVYTVYFNGVGSNRGIVHVTSMDRGGGRCHAASWGPSSDGENIIVDVRCLWGIAQEPEDVEFNASFLDTNVMTGKHAYLRADRLTTMSRYPADPAHSFNSTGGTNTVQRVGVGDYVVRLPGLGSVSRGSVQVSTYVDLSRTCRVADWYGSSGVQVIKVSCKTRTGALADTRFSLTFMQGVGLHGPNGHRAMYLWAERPTTATYQPDVAHRWSSTGNVPTITRLEKGRYEVTLTGLSHSNAVFVTSTGGGSVTCAVYGGFPPPGSGNVVQVECHSVNHGNADAKFVVAAVSTLAN